MNPFLQSVQKWVGGDDASLFGDLHTTVPVTSQVEPLGFSAFCPQCEAPNEWVVQTFSMAGEINR